MKTQRHKKMVDSPFRLNHSVWRNEAAMFMLYHGPQTVDALSESVRRPSGIPFKHAPTRNSIANLLRIDKRFHKVGRVVGYHSVKVNLWGLNEESSQIIELRERVGIEK